jgi:hypothetical protein
VCKCGKEAHIDVQETAFLWDGDGFESARTRQVRHELLTRPRQIRKLVEPRPLPKIIDAWYEHQEERHLYELLGLSVVVDDVGASIAKRVYGPQQNPQQSHVSTASPQQIGVRQNGLLERNRLP